VERRGVRNEQSELPRQEALLHGGEGRSAGRGTDEVKRFKGGVKRKDWGGTGRGLSSGEIFSLLGAGKKTTGGGKGNGRGNPIKKRERLAYGGGGGVVSQSTVVPLVSGRGEPRTPKEGGGGYSLVLTRKTLSRNAIEGGGVRSHLEMEVRETG